jgi:hypothetical protein
MAKIREKRKQLYERWRKQVEVVIVLYIDDNRSTKDGRLLDRKVQNIQIMERSKRRKLAS